MKNMFLFLALISFSPVCAYAQKPILTAADFASWPHLDFSCISNDGEYLAYHISKENGVDDTLFIRSVDKTFEKKIVAGTGELFTEDSKELLFIKKNSLVRLDLSQKTEQVIQSISSFKIPDKGGLPVIAYQTGNGQLRLLNRKTGQDAEFGKVKDYAFSKDGSLLLIFQQSTMRCLDIRTNHCLQVSTEGPVLQYVVDPAEKKIAFITGNNADDLHCTVWEFDRDRDTAARRLVEDNTVAGYAVTAGQMKYSPDGGRLFFRLYRLVDTISAKPGAVSVDIWNYKDQFLQTDQLNEAGIPKTYLSVVDVHTRKTIRLGQEQDNPSSERLDEGRNDDYLLISTKTQLGIAFPEGYRDARDRPDIFLIDTRTGERRCIAHQVQGDLPGFSKGGKYVTWNNALTKTFYFFNLQKGTTYALVSNGDSYSAQAWTANDGAFLMNDVYDIWQVDPEGKNAPVNITHHYGETHHVFLRLSYSTGGNADAIKAGGALILCAFDQQNKDNGFYRVGLGSPESPELLSMGAYAMYFSGGATGVPLDNSLTKARDADVYVLTKQSAEEFPNVVITRDFRTFTPVTALAPQQQVNWLKPELVKWETFDGRPGQGVLYKPEDFDPQKKYPVIFNFYELLSGRLNLYSAPDPGNGAMNIPWFVSHGYLVFCPDIEYVNGDPGSGVFNYVVSAAAMMKNRPYVDGGRMGIQGHSFGGYEVSYLITRTGMFVAACEGSGPTDLLSLSGEGGLAAGSGQPFTEASQMRMKVSFWQNKEAYIENSAVFNADKITTPLLIMHNRQDGIVPWTQALELFTALRRLAKPCYMLQYDHQAHGMAGEDAIDFNRRMTQFFDHYLKGTPEPVWMAKCIPAKLKGIDDGLEYDRP